MQRLEVIQRDRVVLRPPVPHSSEQGLLLSRLHSVLDVTAIETLPLGEFRQEDGSIIEGEVDLLIRQQAGKELDAGVSVRKCDRHRLLEAIESLWIDLVRVARRAKEKNVAVAVLRSLTFLGQLSDDLIAESIGGVGHISTRSDHIQAIEKYDRRGVGAGPLEKEFHAVATLTGIIGFEVGESRREEREAALAGERLSKLSLDPAI